MKKPFLSLLFYALIWGEVDAASLQLTNVHIDQIGYDEHPDAVLCKEFLTSDEQAASFFAKSKIITLEEMHSYMRFPCWVKGKAQLGKYPVSWTIRAGGTATVESDGQVIYLADESQLDTEE